MSYCLMAELGQFNRRFRATRTLVCLRKFVFGIVNDCFVRYAIDVEVKRALNSWFKHRVLRHV